MTTVSVLCALVALVCALGAALASRRCVEAWNEAQKVLRAASSLRGTVDAHSSEIDAIKDSFRQLRGKFYAERAKRAEEPERVDSVPVQADPATYKARLRAQVGLVPGRRP